MKIIHLIHEPITGRLAGVTVRETDGREHSLARRKVDWDKRKGSLSVGDTLEPDTCLGLGFFVRVGDYL